MVKITTRPGRGEPKFSRVKEPMGSLPIARKPVASKPAAYRHVQQGAFRKCWQREPLQQGPLYTPVYPKPYNEASALLEPAECKKARFP